MDQHVLKMGGVGTAYGFLSSGQPLWLGLLENAEVAFSATTNKKYGGPGVFPLATHTSQKEVTISADEALLSLQSIRMTQGDNTPTGTVYRVYQLTVATQSASTLTVSTAAASSAYVSTQTLVFKRDGTRLERMASTPAASDTGKYEETTPSAGLLTFCSADDLTDGIVVHFVYAYNATTNGDSLDMAYFKSTGRACPFEFYYLQTYSDCGAADLLQIHFYQVRPTGELTIAMTQADIVDVSNARLDVEDPLRADQSIGDIFVSAA